MTGFFNSEMSFEDVAARLDNGIFDLLHTGVALLSKEGNFLYCNKAFLTIFGIVENILGKKATDVFLSGEHGVMDVIRTQQPIVSSSLTVNHEHGISFRYPVKDKEGKLCGVVAESIPLSLGKEKLQLLMETIHNLEEAAQHFEQDRSKQVGRLHTFSDIVGESQALIRMKRLGQRFALSREPILLSGESGTGKELVAQALHMASRRSGKPFVTVNCAALPHELIESELFGYAAGAFTGARARGLAGKFEMADGGTIFLDEIGELPLAVQAKLLRVLENGEIQKLAHRSPLYSDFRLICATNRNLSQMVQKGLFREDLFHRICIFELAIPPLRDRLEDIPLLVRYFINRYAGNESSKHIRVDHHVFNLFYQHSWPGNIRELKNILTYALYTLGEKTLLTMEELPQRFMDSLKQSSALWSCGAKTALATQESIPEARDTAWDVRRLEDVSAEAEKRAILYTLEKCQYNKSITAQVLGISRDTLYKKMHEFSLIGKKE